MPHLPRRGLGRHGQPGAVAVHPGWTLSPTAVTDSFASSLPERLPSPAAPEDTGSASRWTGSPAEAGQPVLAAQPVVAELPAPAQPVVDAVQAVELVQHVEIREVQAPFAAVVPSPGWASEWEAVAATPASPSGPVALHTAAAAALDAVFGSTPTPTATATQWLAAPAAQLSALELPLPSSSSSSVADETTPLALETARALPTAAERAAAPSREPSARPPAPGWPAAPTAPPAAPVVVASRPLPPPPSAPPSIRPLSAPTQELVERAMRAAPDAVVQRRSTVRLGFADSSVVNLRPEDPIARALHTVADALIGRDRR